MADTILIDKADVREIRLIHNATNDDEFNAFVLDIQIQYLEPLIGSELYLDFLDNYESSPYDDLLNGTTYTKNGKTINFRGVKLYLVYLFLYKWALEGQVKFTENGRQFFNVDYAERAQKGIDANVIADYESKAKDQAEKITQFLYDNRSTYTLYDTSEIDENVKTSFTFGVVGDIFSNNRLNY